MIKIYNSLFNDQQSKYIAEGMLNQFTNNLTNKEDSEYSYGTYGFYDLKEALYFVPFLHKIISNDYGSNIIFKNNYTRIYTNGNNLKIHTDRPGLDITLSVCLYSDIEFDWPMYISNVQIDTLWDNNLPIEDYKNNALPYVTPVGTGVACYGIKNPHWRDTLICDDNNKVIQAFYHWQFI